LKEAKARLKEKRIDRAKALLVDRTPLLLGKYPMGLNMGRPTPLNPISHLPRFKYKESNKPWIK